MNCHYCNQECERISRYHHHWQCYTCRVEYEGSQITFWVELRNDTYGWQLTFGHDPFPTKILKGQYLWNQNIVLKFDHLIPITPETVKDKLLTYLTFL